MDFQTPLLTGTLIKRYKRFLADIALEDGRTITAHCPNPGAMLGLANVGSEVMVEELHNTARKLPFTWHIEKIENAWVGINTMIPNRLVGEVLQGLGNLEALEFLTHLDVLDFLTHKAEVKYGTNSRVDFVVTSTSQPPLYLEVKNVHNADGTMAYFPDCVTTRGTKHLMELIEVVKAGGRAVLVYVAQRGDCDALRIAGEIDPNYAAATKRAKAAGVQFIAYSCDVSPTAISLAKPLPIIP